MKLEPKGLSQIT